MIRITILDHSRCVCGSFEVSVNPSCILLVKEGRDDIAGRHYREVRRRMKGGS